MAESHEISKNTQTVAARTTIVAGDRSSNVRAISIKVRVQSGSAEPLLLLIDGLHDISATTATDYVRLAAGAEEVFAVDGIGVPQIIARSEDGVTNATYDIHTIGVAVND